MWEKEGVYGNLAVQTNYKQYESVYKVNLLYLKNAEHMCMDEYRTRESLDIQMYFMLIAHLGILETIVLLGTL